MRQRQRGPTPCCAYGSTRPSHRHRVNSGPAPPNQAKTPFRSMTKHRSNLPPFVCREYLQPRQASSKAHHKTRGDHRQSMPNEKCVHVSQLSVPYKSLSLLKGTLAKKYHKNTWPKVE